MVEALLAAEMRPELQKLLGRYSVPLSGSNRDVIVIVNADLRSGRSVNRRFAPRFCRCSNGYSRKRLVGNTWARRRCL
jgi:hypothetical protein